MKHIIHNYIDGTEMDFDDFVQKTEDPRCDDNGPAKVYYNLESHGYDPNVDYGEVINEFNHLVEVKDREGLSELTKKHGGKISILYKYNYQVDQRAGTAVTENSYQQIPFREQMNKLVCVIRSICTDSCNLSITFKCLNVEGMEECKKEYIDSIKEAEIEAVKIMINTENKLLKSLQERSDNNLRMTFEVSEVNKELARSIRCLDGLWHFCDDNDLFNMSTLNSTYNSYAFRWLRSINYYYPGSEETTTELFGRNSAQESTQYTKVGNITNTEGNATKTAQNAIEKAKKTRDIKTQNAQSVFISKLKISDEYNNAIEDKLLIPDDTGKPDTWTGHITDLAIWLSGMEITKGYRNGKQGKKEITRWVLARGLFRDNNGEIITKKKLADAYNEYINGKDRN